jgi:hypothetical protein
MYYIEFFSLGIVVTNIHQIIADFRSKGGRHAWPTYVCLSAAFSFVVLTSTGHNKRLESMSYLEMRRQRRMLPHLTWLLRRLQQQRLKCLLLNHKPLVRVRLPQLHLPRQHLPN